MFMTAVDGAVDTNGNGSLGEDQELAELVAATGRTEQDLRGEAIGRLHRIYIGASAPDGGPTVSTGPFRKLASDRSAEVVLRQVDPKNFELREPFRYCDGTNEFVVPTGDVTDLASVPSLLTWLVPRYGRHTLAALLHDHLQDHVITRKDPKADDKAHMTSERADTYFRDAMKATEVPFLRRWVMWSAVTLRSLFNGGGPARIAAAVYVGLYALVGLLVTPLLIVGLMQDWFGFGLAAIIAGAVVLSPAVLCWLWAKRWRFGLLAAVVLTWIALATALVAALGLAYLGIEWIFERFQHRPAPVLTKNLKPQRPNGRS